MIRSLVGIGLLQFVSMLLLLMRTKILAVAVGPDGVGTISTVDGLMGVVAQTLSLSLPYATLRFLPAALSRSPEETDLLYRQMRLLVATLIVPATAVCVALSIVSPERWGEALVPFRRTVILAFLGLPAVALVPFLTNAVAGIVGHTRSMLLTIANTAVLVLAAVGAAAGLGVEGFYGLYAVLGTVLVVVASRITVPGVNLATRRPLAIRDAFRLPSSVWRFAAWLLPLTFAVPYAAWFVRYSTLKAYGVDAAGILQGAIGISLSARTLLGAAHPVFLTPNVNRRTDSSSRMEWANEFQRTTALLFVLALPPLLLYCDIALRVLYAEPFIAALPFVALFVAAEVINMLSGTYASLIVAGDRMRFHVLQNLAAQSVLVATAAVALPRLGLAGAGIAALSAPVFMFTTTLIYLHRQFDVRMSRPAVRMAALIVLILIVGGIGSQYGGLSPRLLAIKAALCIVIWLVAYALLPPEDKGRLRDGAVRLRKGVLRGVTREEPAS